MHNTSFIFILAFLLGLRHGIDWDHIAAITDIVGSENDRKKSLFFGFLYIIGHATVIIIFGLLAVLVGVKLPRWIDNIMEPFVGLTLIILGIYLLYSIIRHKGNFQLRSRWLLIFRLLHKIIHYFKEKFGHKHEHKPLDYPEKYKHHTAFTIGVIHGIGAETPTQVLLFVTAAGVGGNLVGSLLVLTFVAGLVTSNTLISILGSSSYIKARKNSRIYIFLGVITGIFSLVVGALFLLNKSILLPVIF